MQINVTREHIVHGLPGRVGDCPIALAVKQATGRKWVCVGPLHLFCGDPHHELYHGCSDFVLSFDMGWPVEPFSFELPVRRTPKKIISDWWQARSAGKNCNPRLIKNSGPVLSQKPEEACV